MTGNLTLASSGGDIKIWEVPEVNLVKSFSPHSQPVGSLCWSPNNQCLASAANDKVVVTYIKGDVYDEIDITAGEGNTCVSFNSSSRYLLTGGKSKTLNIWDMKTRSIKKTYKDHKDIVSCLTFNWNDTAIASGSVNGDILLHNVMTGQASDPLRLSKTQAVRDIQFSHFKKSLLGAVSDDGALNLWDSNTKKLSTSFASDHKGPATGLSFSPMNDMLLCSVGLDKRIVFYDVQQKKSVKVMTAESPLTSVDFMSDGGTLAVGSTRGKIYIYDLRSGSSPVNTRLAHKTSVQSLSFQSSTKVNSLANNKSLKPAVSNIKPTAQLPTEQSAVTTDKPSTPTGQPKEQDHGVHTPLTQQNGNDQEDIFSPLRENKTSVVVDNKETTVPGSDEVSLSKNFKENNPPDGLGIFSPVGRNLPATTSSQLHHGDGVTGTENSSVQLGRNSPRTLGVATTAAATPTAPQNVRLSAASSSKDLNNAQDLVPDSSTRSFADTSPGVTGRVHLEGDERQTSGESPPGSVKNSTIRLAQQSPSQPRKPAGGNTGTPDEPVSQTKAAVTTGETDQSSIFDSAKHSVDPLPSVAVGVATTPVADEAASTASNAGLLPFQVQFIKNLIDESLDEFRMALHRDIVNVQVEMLRQFQIQQNELKGMLEKYSVNEALVTEIERLREENNRLKSNY
ncbi:protein NEDD1-like [Orbicella faveolata]|uniref:protein NEDD1-like n=1 Tax=Orbicella faveolata TaxID=48498 RepID=UPI0009E511DE|nr:protein NEDD1-like [Orbicella faveolata]